MSDICEGCGSSVPYSPDRRIAPPGGLGYLRNGAGGCAYRRPFFRRQVRVAGVLAVESSLCRVLHVVREGPKAQMLWGNAPLHVAVVEDEQSVGDGSSVVEEGQPVCSTGLLPQHELPVPITARRCSPHPASIVLNGHLGHEALIVGVGHLKFHDHSIRGDETDD